MGNIGECAVYLAVTGIISFVFGRLLPNGWFVPDSFPYRPFGFEKNGRIYEKIGIHKWQSKLPDMSKIFSGIMPAKNLSGNYKEKLPVMLQETCVAELIHFLLCLSGLYCIVLWPSAGGVIVSVINIVFFNLPFIIIQRYNRPRLMRIYRKINKAEKGVKIRHENTDFELQHR